jgi:hypothetical protein
MVGSSPTVLILRFRFLLQLGHQLLTSSHCGSRARILPDGRLLRGDEHDPQNSGTDLFQQLVGTDERA